jgi:phosphate transport system substrate-binding protein
MKFSGLILLMFACLVLSGCNGRTDPNQPSGFVQVKGSDTMVNAEQMLAEQFLKKYPQISVAVTGGGSGVGVAALINRSCDIAACSREMKPKEIEMAQKRGVDPNEIVVAFDGVAVIVNNRNPISKLTIADLHRIFTGEARSWKEFGGADLPIVTLSREVSSGTYAYFKEQVIHEGKKNSTHEFSHDTLLLSSSQAIVEEVVENPGAIGYLGMGYVSDRTRAIVVSRDARNFIRPILRTSSVTSTRCQGRFSFIQMESPTERQSSL